MAGMLMPVFFVDQNLLHSTKVAFKNGNLFYIRSGTRIPSRRIDMAITLAVISQS
jgi:hypothetical protein